MDQPSATATDTDTVDIERDRLRRLLGTVQELGAMDATDLDGLLRHIVQVACRMTSARYGALVVLAEDDRERISHFITHGLSEKQRRAIGGHPACEGLLGRLMRRPVGFRLDDVTKEPDAIGFPAGHPVMHTFLAMPIRIGSTVFGHLYLTERERNTLFSDQDEETVDALTVVAGSVIDLTRQRLEAKSHRDLSDSLRQINRALLAESDPTRVLPLVLTQARHLRQAKAAGVLLATEDDREFVVLAADGASGSELLKDARRCVQHSLVRRESVHWTNGAAPSDAGAGPRHNSAVPVQLQNGSFAVLVVVGWLPTTTVTSRYTEEVFEAFGDQVGLVLDRVKAGQNHDVLVKVEDRERIARDLHDLVIQRIYAAGLALQGASRLEPKPAVAERIDRTIVELDATIRDLRATIFALTPAKVGHSVHDQIGELLSGYALNLGFEPAMRCDEEIEGVLDIDGRQALMMVLREALSNVVRHAQATSVEVAVFVEEKHLVAVVTDNGVGVPSQVMESGLNNVRTRAQQLGGSMDLLAHAPRGSVLRWQVPIHY
ncbi:GAF domain-containing protein [Ornithinimicrobium sp. Arc0846-15]|nr:GAF domain-containing protein [Ornithinimicrobium laminariae]